MRTLDAAAVRAATPWPELIAAIAARATIFVDSVAGASMSGDLAQPIADGVITEDSVVADLQALAAGDHPGRTSPDEVTLFKSAGFAAADLAADLAAARLALR